MLVTRRSFTAGLAALAGGTVMAAPRRSGTAPKMLDTIVLGAGMAGLNTAWLLEQQGQSVTVLEARQRVGGRVLTLLDQPGFPELGFNAAAAGYGRALDAGKRAGIEWVDVADRYRRTGAPNLFLNGQPYTREQWAASPLNPLPPALKSLMPWEVVGKLLQDNKQLPDWTTWTDPANAGLDIPLHQFLKDRGLSDSAIHLVYDLSPNYGPNAYGVSALMLQYNDGFTRSQAGTGPQSFSVKGGNARLPAGMAKLLKGDLLLGREVVGITSDGAFAAVYCADGSTFQARRVVCTLPFAAMRRMRFVPGLTGPQAEAVANLGYQSLSAAFLTVKSPFWDVDKTSPTMWSDGLSGTVLPQHFGENPEEVTGLLLQARGALARRWDQLGKDAALAAIIAEIEAVRPAAKGLLVPHALHSWEQEAFSGGSWAYFAPGQIAGFVNQMAQPAGRIHFAGEHTAVGSRGVEGALESSERVALEVLSA